MLESSSVLKFSTALQFSKKYLQKHILEEYKLISSKILSELGKMLQKYAEYNMTLPVGIVNLINYNWEDLTEGAYNKNYESKDLMLKQDKALQRDSKSVTVVDSKGYKITSYSREECHKENHLAIAEKESVALSKSLEKLCFVNQHHCFHGSSLPVVIHFSLTSKACLENGWIFPSPFSKSEALKWKTVLSSAVKKLQVAIIQIKEEEAKLKKEGFTKQLILRHYNDPKDEPEVGKDGHMTQCFWFELLKGKPQMPQIKKDDPMMKKFHYALVDGSSLT
ncbi:uncharacterized protein LOC126075892 [Elephas maximus indicus]|uniref:uncharacterized protein LOC126075892 n=1 Tax=Elephas maximus indicus TaxID=99487 RepID=UPI002115F7BC|nr:uncharacterized protein LOC126075892 [Elephas maximus indicus]